MVSRAVEIGVRSRSQDRWVRRRSGGALALLAALCLVWLAACGVDTGSEAAAPTSSPGTTSPVVREVLAEQVDPAVAPDHTLTLVRYTIAPGAKLAPHIHPGIQLARIESGELTYTVVSGTAVIHRGAADGPREEVTGPATVTLGPGDTVSEQGDMVHFGANETADPIVILATLLTEDGEDLAVTVTTVR